MQEIRNKSCIFAARINGFDIMINRVLIRLKVVQVIYAYYQNGGQSINSAEIELARSLDSAYSLYKTLLYIPVALVNMARKSVAKQKRMGAAHISGKEERLAANIFVSQLETNSELLQFIGENDLSWLTDSDWLKDTYAKVLESDEMEEYWQNECFDFESDKELCRKLYKIFVQENEEFDSLLEEADIYWNGDKELIDSFVLKTFRSFADGSVADQPLKAEFKDDDDRQFAIDLLHHGIETAPAREAVVAANCRRWDPSRLAFMDVIIIQVAMAEMLHFPQIPLKVTVNEYVELAKSLSTPSSGSFVNGMLETIIKELTTQGKLNKEL